ncbi:glycosyltransferase family 2 protein [Parablautia intestinalis]|uniref:glycosyltransferase family 2 protein n=2 Tax=Parablautia intestinalis TaxID=2320100 RepID=UPI00256EDDA1|nr:glycosyltransferase family 2 protein [Parablautia intestinalis]
MKKYKISVIVPVYNTEKYLSKCVATLTGQTYDNLEILLVDDGSTDGSGRLCDMLALKDGRIRTVHKENGGLISAWKKGVCESTGEYLCFVDSDDWVDLNMLSEMGEKLSGNAKEIIASDYVIERGEEHCEYVWQQLPPGEYDKKAMDDEVIPKLLGHEHRYVCISRCMKLISRKLVEDNCKYSNPVITTGEDITIMLPALIDCERLVIMEHKAYYHYLYVKDSMIHKYDKGLYQNIQLLRQIVEQILKDKFTGEKLSAMSKMADKEYIFMLFLALKNEARGNASGYRKNILQICREGEVRKLCKNAPVNVEEKANKLLYLVLCHPNEITVRLLRLAMIVYYRRQ